jgi:hypothetical protein
MIGDAARKKCVRYARGANTRFAAFALMRTPLGFRFYFPLLSFLKYSAIASE